MEAPDRPARLGPGAPAVVALEVVPDGCDAAADFKAAAEAVLEQLLRFHPPLAGAPAATVAALEQVDAALLGDDDLDDDADGATGDEVALAVAPSSRARQEGRYAAVLGALRRATAAEDAELENCCAAARGAGGAPRGSVRALRRLPARRTARAKLRELVAALEEVTAEPVSYTHLTLPTILLV